MRRSNSWKQKGEGEWMVAQMVTPLLTRSFTTDITSFAVYESRPDVGSCSASGTSYGAPLPAASAGSTRWIRDTNLQADSIVTLEREN